MSSAPDHRPGRRADHRSGRRPGDHLARLVAVVALAIAACKDPPSPAPSPPSPARATSATADPAAAGAVAAGPVDAPSPASQRSVVIDEPSLALPRQESFTLLDAGAPPRAPLRYRLATAATTFTIETTLSTRQIVAGSLTPPAALPVIRDGFAVSAAAPGTVTLRGLPGQAATASAEADAYLAPWRTLLEDRAFTVAFDDRGSFVAPSGPARDELVQRLLSTVIPLPAEPVGSGASWRVVTILWQRPVYAKQTATYTLQSVGASWRLRVRLLRVGEHQQITDPSLPAGTAAELLAMVRRLEGDVEVDPRSPLIRRGSFTVESRLHVRLTGPGEPPAEHMFEDTGQIALAQTP